MFVAVEDPLDVGADYMKTMFMANDMTSAFVLRNRSLGVDAANGHLHDSHLKGPP